MSDKKHEHSDHFTQSMSNSTTRAHFEREWFVDEVLCALEAKMSEMNVSRTELARRLNCTPANVTRLLRRGTNLTVGSLVDLALALDHRFLAPQLQALAAEPPWVSSCSVVLEPADVWAPMRAPSEADEVPASPLFSWPDYATEGEAGTVLN